MCFENQLPTYLISCFSKCLFTILFVRYLCLYVTIHSFVSGFRFVVRLCASYLVSLLENKVAKNRTRTVDDIAVIIDRPFAIMVVKTFMYRSVIVSN